MPAYSVCWKRANIARMFALIVVCCLSSCGLNGATFAGGTGAAGDPYLVATATQLDAVRQDLTAHYRQTADIDLGTAPWSSGSGWNPIGSVGFATAFRGVYDGGGHRIMGLTIQRPGTGYQGLFGYAINASIRNVAVENASVTGGDNCGSLIGHAMASGLGSVTVSGVVNGGNRSGGLLGSAVDCDMEQAHSAASVTGLDASGGLVGYVLGGRISRCSATGSVSGRERVGGLVGEAAVAAPPTLPAIADYSPRQGPAGASVFVRFAEPLIQPAGFLQAKYDGAPVSVIGISDDVIQCILPEDATSGDLILVAGETEQLVGRFDVLAPVITPIFNQVANPSGSNQTLQYSDEISVTLPGGFLDRARRVMISTVANAPPNPFMPQGGAALDISIEGLTQLPAPVQIGIRYDPAALDPALPASEQLIPIRYNEELATWETVPYWVDEAGQTVQILTDHLTFFAIPTAAAAGMTAVKTVAAVGVAVTAGWVFEKLTFSTYTTPQGNFRIVYIEPYMAVGDDIWVKPAEATNGYDGTHLRSVQDIGGILETALSNYRGLGLREPVIKPGWLWGESKNPITVKLSGLWSRTSGFFSGSEEPQYGKIFGALHFPAKIFKNYAGGENRLSERNLVSVGHELFHRMQAEYYSMRRFWAFSNTGDFWWVEACAEYAGCRDAWGPGTRSHDDILTEGLRADFLTHPLGATGLMPEYTRDHEYMASVFIQFLVDKMGFSFKELVEFVADGEPFARLDAFIDENGPNSWDSFGSYFQRYAQWATFSNQGLLNGFPLATFEDITASATSGEIAGQKDVIEWKEGQTLKVTRGGAHGWVDIYRIPEGERLSDDRYTHRVDGLYHGQEATIGELVVGDVLYFLATNDRKEAVDIPVTLTIENPDGDVLNYTFSFAAGPAARLWAVKVIKGPIHNKTRDRWYEGIQRAVDYANDGDEILVYPGEYVADLWIRKAVQLKAAGPRDKTIIRGAPGNWSYIVNTEADVTIEGFTIEPGEKTGSISTRGISVRYGTSPTIRNNKLSGFGVALQSAGADSAPTFTGNVLTGNNQGIYLGNSSLTATVSGNLIEGSKIVGIQVSGSAALIKKNRILNNGRSGILVQGNKPYKTEIIGNEIRGNSTPEGGGGINLEGTELTIEITGNQILNNSAARWGGGINDGTGRDLYGTPSAHVRIRGNTITGNTSGSSGGGIYTPRAEEISGNSVSGNHSRYSGGGIRGKAVNWKTEEVITIKRGIEYEQVSVPRFSPPFKHEENSVSGNTHEDTFSAWGPDDRDNKHPDAGYDVCW